MKKEELIKKLEGIKEISPVVSIESMISLIQGLESPSEIQDESITVDLATTISEKIEESISRAGIDLVDLDSANFEIGYDNRIELTDVEIDLSNVVATLYVYDYVSSSNMGSGGSSSNRTIKAFVAPNEDFMTSIFETFEGSGWYNSWGDFEEFEKTYDDDEFDKWELKNTLALTKEELESLGMNLDDFEKNVKTSLEDLEIKDFEIEDFGESQYNNLFFDTNP